MNKYLPYARQDVLADDIAAVAEVMQSDYLTQGPMIAKFEQAIADYSQVEHAIALSSATAALHLSCLALGVGEGDRVWTSPNTFVASANCALYCGADIDFIDICPDTYNISIESLEEKLIQAKNNNALPKLIIPVHFAGQSCDMKAIRRLADQYGFYIIEDASHAIGGEYFGRPVGSCDYSDISIFSFHAVKLMTTGEGGVATTRDATLAQRLNMLRTHGITRDPQLMTKIPDGPWYYEQLSLGFNYRITDMQCALGLQQLSRLDRYVEKRNELVNLYNNKLKCLPLKLPTVNPGTLCAYHLYVIQVDATKSTISRLEIFKYLQAKKIGVNVHYIPVHTQPYYQSLGFKTGDYPIAESYYAHAITLPLYPQMTEQDVDRVVDALTEILA